jgi:hypothetical protein
MAFSSIGINGSVRSGTILGGEELESIETANLGARIRAASLGNNSSDGKLTGLLRSGGSGGRDSSIAAIRPACARMTTSNTSFRLGALPRCDTEASVCRY